MTLSFVDLWCAVADDFSNDGTPSFEDRTTRRDTGDALPPNADAALVARVRDGDRVAFHEIVETYAAGMVQLASFILRDRDAGDDAAQDVFGRLWATRAKWILHGSLRAYLLRAVANHARKVLTLRANRRRLETMEHERLAPSDHASFDTEIDAMLWDAVHALPARWRDAVLLRYVQRLSFAEVGETLGVSEDAAKKLVRRALSHLRTTLAPRFAE